MSGVGKFDDRQTLQVRLLVLRIGLSVAVVALAVGFWMLQIVQHPRYEEMAENNHLRTIPVRAPRGVLFDRNGKVLVQNTYSFTIALVREQTANPRNLTDTLERLAAATGADESRIADIVRRHRTDAAFRPIPVIEHASFDQVAAVMARRLELPGVVVQKVSTRTYPEGGFAAHLFGYVSEIQESQLAQVEYRGLQAGAIVGQAGLEKTYNLELMGKDGAQYVAVNSRGRELAEEGEDDAVDGERLQLTIDYDLQQALETAFKSQGFSGAAVFLNPQTGEVLAMTSQPEFDPNAFANGLDRVPVGQARARSAEPPGRPAHPGALLARIDLQDRDGRGGAVRGHHHAGLQGDLHGEQGLLRPRLSLRPGATARSTCVRPSRSPATCTSTPSPAS